MDSGLDILSGAARGPIPSLLRGAAALAEPFYAGAMSLRNLAYDRGILKRHTLGRPTISVGNLTSGGTGKTPVVRWLAGQFLQSHNHPAILLRGYRSSDNGSDEQRMLSDYLNPPGVMLVPVHADPDRARGAAAVIGKNPEVDLFILDDGFQHRRVLRDFDLVLVSAVHRFGFDHVLPRGLLREPRSGISRADAILITGTNEDSLVVLREQFARLAPSVPIYEAEHRHVGLRSAISRSSDEPDVSLDELTRRRFFAFAGIGSPSLLARQLQSFGTGFAGARWFADHHQYTMHDLSDLSRSASVAGAEVLVTTEKDWVKLKEFAANMPMAIWRLELEVVFRDAGGERLLEQIRRCLAASAGK